MAEDIAQLGIEVDSSGVDKAKVSLDALAKSGEQAERSAQGVGEAWSSVGQKAGSASANVEGATNAFKGGNEAIRRQQQELSALLGSIDPVVGALDRLDKQEQKLRDFRASGALDAETFEQFKGTIDRNRAALSVFDEGLARTGNTAKQTQQAIRQLPAQFSDIFISLQAGQSPLQVFLQQGAQIKDSFGGIGPALRETATFARGLITPFSAAAAAVAALGVAYLKGADEATEFEKALILTGNAAGTTAEQLTDTARALDDIIGTQAKASEALTQLAATGKIGAEQFKLLGEAAISFERATGTAIEESIKQYVKLGEDPVQAIVKLNETTNFLTEDILNQIIALQRQGETAQAAAVAQEAYARAQIQRSQEVVENLGSLERGWQAVVDTATEAWDAMLGIGRAETAQQEIERLEEQLQRIEQLGNRRGRAQFGIGLDQGQADTIRERIAFLKEEIAQETANANKRREQNLEDQKNFKQKAEAEKELQRERTKTARTPVFREDAGTRLLDDLRQQESVLRLQLSTTRDLTGAEAERAKFAQTLADLQSKDVLTAAQKSLLANKEALQTQLDTNVALEQELQLRDQIKDTERLRIDILRSTGQIRAANDAEIELEFAERRLEFERTGNQEALQRLDTLKKINEIEQRFGQKPGTIEGVSRAPNITGVDAAVGGEFSEIQRLNEQADALEAWRDNELQKQEAFLEAKAINEETYAERVYNVQEQFAERSAQLEAAKNQLILSSASDLFGELADTAKQLSGEQSSAYKAAFALSKGFAIADATLKLSTALTQALADPSALTPAQKFANVAAVGAAGANLLSQITSATLSFDGGGYTGSGPRSGGLDGKGGFMAMLHPNETVVDHTKGQRTGGNVVNMPINVNVTAEPGVTDTQARRQGQITAEQIDARVRQLMQNEKRPGGLLAS